MSVLSPTGKDIGNNNGLERKKIDLQLEVLKVCNSSELEHLLLPTINHPPCFDIAW